MKKVIIGLGCTLGVVLVVGILVVVLHKKNVAEPVETLAPEVQREIEQIVETAAVESEEYVPEIGDFSMEAAVNDVIFYVLNNPILSQYFTKEDIKIKVRDGDTVIYLDNCDRTGYSEVELDMYVIPAYGEPYDVDAVIELYHWLVNHGVTEQVTEAPEETTVDASKADLFNEGNSEPEAGWKRISLDIFNNVEEFGEFSDESIEEWFNPAFLSIIKDKTGGYEKINQLANFLNMDAPYFGTKWDVLLDDPTTNDLWGTVSVNRGGMPYKYRIHLNLDTEEFEVFEEE